MMPSSQDPMTVPVKPFLYQPKPASLTLAQMLTAQAVGVLCALVGWPLFFVVSMALPLNLLQHNATLPGWFALSYSAAQFLAFGSILGLAQLWVIHRWVPAKQGWLISSALTGLLLFPAAAYLAGRLILPAGALHMPLVVLAGGLGGLALGVAQSPFLGARRSIWRLSSVLTWAVVAPLALLAVERLAYLLAL